MRVGAGSRLGVGDRGTTSGGRPNAGRKLDNTETRGRRPRRTPPDAGEVVAELLLMCDEFWPIDKPHTQRSGTSSRPRKAFALPHMVDVA